jgi:hypothetical protein
MVDVSMFTCSLDHAHVRDLRRRRRFPLFTYPSPSRRSKPSHCVGSTGVCHIYCAFEDEPDPLPIAQPVSDCASLRRVVRTLSQQDPDVSTRSLLVQGSGLSQAIAPRLADIDDSIDCATSCGGHRLGRQLWPAVGHDRSARRETAALV